MLKLRPYEKSDSARILSWLEDESAFRKWSADRYGSYPITPDEMNAFYAENPKMIPLTAVDGEETVGHMIMRFTDKAKRVIRFGFIIVDSKIRGRGYGRKMLSLALERAFGDMGASKVTIGVFENNPPAQKCYYSLGFAHREDWDEYLSIMGEKWKCLEFELTKEDYYNRRSI